MYTQAQIQRVAQENKANTLKAIQETIDTLTENYYRASCSALDIALESCGHVLASKVLIAYRTHSLARENLVGFTDIPAFAWADLSFAKQREIRLQRLRAFYEYMLKEEA